MARTGMADLIADLRGMTNTGPEDYTIGSVTYWTDNQLQDILDQCRTEVVEDDLVAIDENTAGAVVSTTRYYSHYGNFEETTGGTAIFIVRDGTYNVVGTASYTADYRRGEVIFSSDTDSATRHLTGRSYDLNKAAAMVWERKAGQVAQASYSWSTDNMRVDKSAQRKEAIEMARYYRQMAGPQVTELRRGDEC